MNYNFRKVINLILILIPCMIDTSFIMVDIYASSQTQREQSTKIESNINTEF